MNIKFGMISVFLVMVQLAAPAMGQGRPVPVTDSDTALQFNGFQVKPPPGSNWYFGARDERNVMFGKRGESRVHSFVAVALSRELQRSPATRAEFFEFARKFKVSGGDIQRQTMLEQEFVETDAPAPDCLRYRIKVSDRGVQGANRDPLLIEIVGVVCLNPEGRKHLIDANYSERGGPQSSSAQLKEEGEAFLRSLSFTAVN